MTAAPVTVGGALAGSGLLLALFTVGFRTKFAPLHAAIRRCNRDVTNPRQLQHAGRPGSWAWVIHHIERGEAAGLSRRTCLAGIRSRCLPPPGSRRG